MSLLIVSLSMSVFTYSFLNETRILPYLDSIPEFQLVFEGGKLTQTSFDTYPHHISIDWEHLITLSPDLTLETADPQTSGIFLLQDGFMFVEDRDIGQKIQKMTYAELTINNLTVDRQSITNLIEMYFPDIRKFLAMIVFGIISVFFFVMYFVHLVGSLFVALVIYIISHFTDRLLEFDEAYSYVLHTTFIVTLLSLLLSFLVPIIFWGIYAVLHFIINRHIYLKNVTN